MKQLAGASPGSWLIVAVLILPFQAFAEHRLAIEPSVEVIEVHDDNLNFSEEQPVRDRIRRITPNLALRFDSPRWSARGTYGIDSEQFEAHPGLDNDRARERALIGIQYRAGSRLTLSLNSAYLSTDTLADLNIGTGLGSSRVQGRQLSVSPSARLRISPRVTASASATSTSTNMDNGIGQRAQVQTIGVERQVSPRDLVRLDYQNSDLVFDADTTQSINSHTVLAGCSRGLGARTNLMFQAGPRITDGSASTDLAASLSHDWRFSSIAISLQRSQTTVIGHVGAVDTESLQARFLYTPNRRLTAYAAPALIRSTEDQLQARVYRLGLGARYAVTPLVGVDVAYNLDRQNGAIDPLRANAEFSRAVLSFGFTTRWNSADRHGTGGVR